MYAWLLCQVGGEEAQVAPDCWVVAQREDGWLTWATLKQSGESQGRAERVFRDELPLLSGKGLPGEAPPSASDSNTSQANLTVTPS